jgi:SAM-dependent methyltransferase
VSLDRVEFDDYAADYDAGADSRLKRLLGDDAAFMEWKVAWLTNRLGGKARGQRPRPQRVLDFGCGTGLTLSLWQKHRPLDSLCGLEVSDKMLEQAVQRWPKTASLPDFRLLRPGQPTFPHASFDLIVISCVLHHVPTEDRNSVLREAFDLLKPGGQICVFEHNPRNFLVRYVVRHTKIDQHAILLRAEETTSRLQSVGFGRLETSFILFFPPMLTMAAGLETYLARLPLGGQYAVTARK